MRIIILSILIFVQISIANEFQCQVMFRVNGNGEIISSPIKANTKFFVTKKKFITIDMDGYKYTSYFSESIQVGIDAYKTGPNLIVHYTNNNTFVFKNGTMSFAMTHCQ